MALRMWASSAAHALSLSTATACRPAFSLFRSYSTVIEGLKYATSHEWVKHEGSVATVGITHHAQDHLGEIVFVELPDVGKPAAQGVGFGTVESVKAASDVISPISGEIVEVNSELCENPRLLNTCPYEDGWMIKVKPSNPSELDCLMGAKEYSKFCEEDDSH